MRKHIWALAAVVAATTGASSLAFANEPYFPRGEKAFQRLDANRNGRLEPAELAPVLDRRLAKLDGNGDKAVSGEEIEAAMIERIKKRRGRIMLLLDENRDGAVTQAELDRVVNDMFDKADANGDGGVDLAEIRSFKRGPWRKALIDGQTQPN